MLRVVHSAEPGGGRRKRDEFLPMATQHSECVAGNDLQRRDRALHAVRRNQPCSDWHCHRRRAGRAGHACRGQRHHTSDSWEFQQCKSPLIGLELYQCEREQELQFFTSRLRGSESTGQIQYLPCPDPERPKFGNLLDASGATCGHGDVRTGHGIVRQSEHAQLCSGHLVGLVECQSTRLE